jgi:hypothetical protein
VTTFNPDALAREWAAKDYADFTDVPGCTPILDTIVNERAQHYLSFARALIEQSGAVEALAEADYFASASAPYRNKFAPMVESALANLLAVEGKP